VSTLQRITNSTAFYAVFLALAVLALGELGARAWFAREIGPRVLLYGTPWYRNLRQGAQEQSRLATESDPELKRESERARAPERGREDSVDRHRNDLGAYSKYFPHEKKTTPNVETGGRIPVRINSAGFRGAEFEPQKPPGMVRILTLGASSTFGYYDADDETYPFYLEELLNQRCAGARRFEVINFGIPHATSKSILALFLAEGVPLDPDVVTFYEGRNDSVAWTPGGRGFPGKLYAAALRRSILFALLEQLRNQEGSYLTSAAYDLPSLAAERSRFFLANLARILEVCRSRRMQLIVASQQASAVSWHPQQTAERERLRGVTYRDETRAIRGRLDRGQALNLYEYSLLVHERLMDDLALWAQREGVPFVDVIAALDQDRHQLLSWVHLSPQANRVIAENLAEPILRGFCPAHAQAAN
jgi:lysophospholipase L1-like esterase